jgi:cysteine desulfuration protein SufE
MDTALSTMLDELLETFEDLVDWNDRYQYIVELGYDLPQMAEADKTRQTKVDGCLSTVWLVGKVRQDQPQVIDFVADSDSVIVKGLIAVLLAIYSGRTPEEILSIDAEAIFAQLGLKEHLSSRRRNGLAAMVKRIQSLAEQQV